MLLLLLSIAFEPSAADVESADSDDAAAAAAAELSFSSPLFPPLPLRLLFRLRSDFRFNCKWLEERRTCVSACLSTAMARGRVLLLFPSDDFNHLLMTLST